MALAGPPISTKNRGGGGGGGGGDRALNRANMVSMLNTSTYLYVYVVFGVIDEPYIGVEYRMFCSADTNGPVTNTPNNLKTPINSLTNNQNLEV